MQSQIDLLTAELERATQESANLRAERENLASQVTLLTSARGQPAPAASQENASKDAASTAAHIEAIKSSHSAETEKLRDQVAELHGSISLARGELTAAREKETALAEELAMRPTREAMQGLQAQLRTS